MIPAGAAADSLAVQLAHAAAPYPVTHEKLRSCG